MGRETRAILLIQLYKPRLANNMQHTLERELLFNTDPTSDTTKALLKFCEASTAPCTKKLKGNLRV